MLAHRKWIAAGSILTENHTIKILIQILIVAMGKLHQIINVYFRHLTNFWVFFLEIFFGYNFWSFLLTTTNLLQ